MMKTGLKSVLEETVNTVNHIKRKQLMPKKMEKMFSKHTTLLLHTEVGGFRAETCLSEFLIFVQKCLLLCKHQSHVTVFNKYHCCRSWHSLKAFSQKLMKNTSQCKGYPSPYSVQRVVLLPSYTNLNSGPKLEGKKPERFPPQNNFLMPKSEE
jgi:hypothetical protein